MGLFSRKESASQRRPIGRSRPSVSSEAQAAELRVKARRRLAGAVAIVLCAVIVLPMLLDGEPIKVPSNIEVSIPSRTSPFNPNLSAENLQAGVSEAVEQGVQTPIGSDQTQALTTPPVAPASQAASSMTPGGTSSTSQTELAASKPLAATETKPADPLPPVKVDEGARARAILEGRTLPSADARVAAANTAIKENLVVQIASYSAQADAETRRDTLKGQGITNAYVEPVTVSGKQVFRLRVGPFSSREAAQAAQARLRTLGYANGFITTQ